MDHGVAISEAARELVNIEQIQLANFSVGSHSMTATRSNECPHGMPMLGKSRRDRSTQVPGSAGYRDPARHHQR
jgi:hypothetical protein